MASFELQKLTEGGRSRSTSVGSSNGNENKQSTESARSRVPLPPLVLPEKPTTFDDFLSPTHSERELQPFPAPLQAPEPLAPPGLDLNDEPVMYSELWTDALAFPSSGSASHGSGQCKPCAFHHTKGCARGAMCTFCHLCLPGEKKRRQKEKQQAAKASTNKSS